MLLNTWPLAFILKGFMVTLRFESKVYLYYGSNILAKSCSSVGAGCLSSTLNLWVWSSVVPWNGARSESLKVEVLPYIQEKAITRVIAMQGCSHISANNSVQKELCLPWQGTSTTGWFRLIQRVKSFSSSAWTKQSKSTNLFDVTPL